MLRNMCNGIVTKIAIIRIEDGYGSASNFSLEKRLDDVLKVINKKIDMSFYEQTIVLKNGRGCLFSIKPEVIDNNIHDLIGEMSSMKIPNVNYFMNFAKKDIDVNAKSFVDDYPFKYKEDTRNGDYIEVNGNIIREEYNYLPMYWLLDNDELGDNYRIYISCIPMWVDISKYFSDCDTMLFRLLNTMKTKYHKTELSKALVYYVRE